MGERKRPNDIRGPRILGPETAALGQTRSPCLIARHGIGRVDSFNGLSLGDWRVVPANEFVTKLPRSRCEFHLGLVRFRGRRECSDHGSATPTSFTVDFREKLGRTL